MHRRFDPDVIHGLFSAARRGPSFQTFSGGGRACAPVGAGPGWCGPVAGSITTGRGEFCGARRSAQLVTDSAPSGSVAAAMRRVRKRRVSTPFGMGRSVTPQRDFVVLQLRFLGATGGEAT